MAGYGLPIFAASMSLILTLVSLTLTCLFVFHYSNLKACTFGRNKNGMCMYSDLIAQASTPRNGGTLSFPLTTPLSIETAPKGVSERVVIQYPSSTGTREYSVDFDYTNVVPSGSGSNEYPTSTTSSGYFCNDNGVSVYLKYYYENQWSDNLNNISNLIVKSLTDCDGPGHKSSDETDSGTCGFVVKHLSTSQNKINIIAYLKDPDIPVRSGIGVSTNTPSESLFQNFTPENNIDVYGIGRNLSESYNPMHNILDSRKRHLDGCSKDSSKCFCVEPGFVNRPHSADYSYNPSTGIYTKIPGRSGPETTRTVSSISTKPIYTIPSAGDEGRSDLVVQTSLGTIGEKDSGFTYTLGGKDLSPGQVSDQNSNRYPLQYIFCADPGTNFDPGSNSLYGQGLEDSLGTDIYLNSVSNAERDDNGQVTLGFANK